MLKEYITDEYINDCINSMLDNITDDAIHHLIGEYKRRNDSNGFDYLFTK